MFLRILAIILVVILLISLKDKYTAQKVIEIDEVDINESYKCVFPSGFDNTLSNPYYEDHDVIDLPKINPCEEGHVPIDGQCIKACRTCKIGMCMDAICQN